MWRIVLIICWLSLGVAPALAQDKVTIHKLNDFSTAAFNTRDAAAVAVCRKVGGDRKLATDIWNTDR